MIPPVPTFTRADCELLARYGNARVRWSRVDAVSKRKLADVRERVKQLLTLAAGRQATGVPMAVFVTPSSLNARVPADYWGALYPVVVPGKAFALQFALIISANGAELCLTMGSGRRDARDPKTAAHNRQQLEEAQQQLAALPSDVATAVETRLAGRWRLRAAARRPARAADDFDTLAEWAQYAASPLGEGASVSCILSPSALEKLGAGLLDRFVEMTAAFVPLIQYVYGDDEAAARAPETESVVASPPARRFPSELGADPTTYMVGAEAARLVAEHASPYRSGPPSGPPRATPPAPPFTLEAASADLFIAPDELRRFLSLLDRRRNLILEGPPGVGKTFIARRLAYALLGAADTARFEMVQFHPSYAYEDFVRGWRPAAGGSFVLRNGVFYEFCAMARSDADRPYVFVIDEINRGNVSAIFGELLMLLERDKRGDDFAVPLTYTLGRTDRFAIPPNVHLIATMNTADRSVAMVDYALRRRFAFARLRPAFDTEAFASYLARQRVSKSLIRRIVSRMTALNADIVDDRKRLGPGFEIGHSPFVPAGAGPYDDAWYRDIVLTEIEPLLREYWFDDPDRAAEVVARLLA